MNRYIPKYDEAKADAELLLRGFVNQVRCETCGYRITWASDTEEKEGKCIYKTCICSSDPEWFNVETKGLTYGMVEEVWKDLFGDMFPTRWNSYIFERFINGLQVKQYLLRMYEKQQEEK